MTPPTTQRSMIRGMQWREDSRTSAPRTDGRRCRKCKLLIRRDRAGEDVERGLCQACRDEEDDE